MSFTEAMATFPGCKMGPSSFNDHFALFYSGPRKSVQIWFLYGEYMNYEHPSSLRLSLDDTVSRDIFKEALQPCILVVGHNTSSKILKPSYEFYHLVLFAKKLGMIQLPPQLVLAALMWPEKPYRDPWSLSGYRSNTPCFR